MTQLESLRVEQLAVEFMLVVRRHYVRNLEQTHPDRALEILNALAVTVETVLAGCDERAERFFDQARAQQRMELDR
jgi:hypothetical protein